MSLSRLSADVLNNVFSFLPVEDAHRSGVGCKTLNQVIHTTAFSRMQLRRLFPGQEFALPVAEYQKIMRIFSNFAAGRCGYFNVALPTPSRSCPNKRLGSFCLEPSYGHKRESYVSISGQRGMRSRIQIWENAWSRSLCRPCIPFKLSLYPAPGIGAMIASQRYWTGPQWSQLNKCLDFSLAEEEILIGLADKFSSRPDDDATDMDLMHPCFKNSLCQKDKNGIYQELCFLNSTQSTLYADYGQLAFEEVEGSGMEREFFVSNKERVEAILHYCMRLIARRYAAPQGDPMAEDLFNRLPQALRNPVYAELHAIRPPAQGEDVWNYGELAFHGRLGTVTNLERRAAILNFVNKGQKVL